MLGQNAKGRGCWTAKDFKILYPQRAHLSKTKLKQYIRYLNDLGDV